MLFIGFAGFLALFLRELSIAIRIEFFDDFLFSLLEQLPLLRFLLPLSSAAFELLGLRLVALVLQLLPALPGLLPLLRSHLALYVAQALAALELRSLRALLLVLELLHRLWMPAALELRSPRTLLLVLELRSLLQSPATLLPAAMELRDLRLLLVLEQRSLLRCPWTLPTALEWLLWGKLLRGILVLHPSLALMALERLLWNLLLVLPLWVRVRSGNDGRCDGCGDDGRCF
ncbi:hypothetical protein PDESU_00851 [Pontiella desulfatans]|uniref:Uncharacterized protein n=1 Tax=Pontiella desulfatans TaxID=2750659 RepID=A0A6C2TX89_PONDE|nr:hypothetical protein [Pontiella desulfatans]VGO12300.1 hypothetical protein PDESU_00851 [Pontiella desulfatans]